MRDAARWRLKLLRENTEYVEIPKDKYERLKANSAYEYERSYRAGREFNLTQRVRLGFLSVLKVNQIAVRELRLSKNSEFKRVRQISFS